VETKREGGGNEKGSIRFHINPAMLAELRNAPGFTAVIINMHPMNLRQFLGINHVSG